MPSIIIKEKDTTTSIIVGATDTWVFIPGLSGQTSEGPGAGIFKFNTLAEFKDTITRVGTDTGYVMAYECLKNGLKVLYGIPKKIQTTSEGAEELDVPVSTQEELIASLGSQACKIWSELQDRGLYNPRFITTGGYASSVIYNQVFTYFGEPATNQNKRSDCAVLVDYDRVIASSKEQAIASLRSNVGTANKYAACFFPWCKFNTGVSGETNGTMLPGSQAYLNAYGNSISINPTWFAAAGSVRGQVKDLDRPEFELGEIEANNLQADNVIAINPICTINPYGLVIWGNRTAITNNNGLTASSFLNVRNLISDIRKTVFVTCKKLTFEQNSDVLWANFYMSVSPLLDQMATGEGIKGYKIVRVKTGVKATVKARIIIIPIEAVENFEIEIDLTDSIAEVVE